MIKIDVELQRSNGRLLKREPVFISDDNFSLNLSTDYHLSDIIVVYANGTHIITKHHSNLNEIPVPKEMLKAGVLNVKVTLLALGVAVKSWNVEPIILKELDKGFEAYAEIEELKTQLCEKNQMIDNLLCRVKVIEENATYLQHQVAQLWELNEV